MRIIFMRRQVVLLDRVDFRLFNFYMYYNYYYYNQEKPNGCKVGGIGMYIKDILQFRSSLRYMYITRPPPFFYSLHELIKNAVMSKDKKQCWGFYYFFFGIIQVALVAYKNYMTHCMTRVINISINKLPITSIQ